MLRRRYPGRPSSSATMPWRRGGYLPGMIESDAAAHGATMIGPSQGQVSEGQVSEGQVSEGQVSEGQVSEVSAMPPGEAARPDHAGRRDRRISVRGGRVRTAGGGDRRARTPPPAWSDRAQQRVVPLATALAKLIVRA